MDQIPVPVRGILFEPCTDESVRALREEVLRRRDNAIIACTFEVALSLFSILLYDIRRSILIPLLNIGLAGLSAVGLYGAVVLSFWRILVHGVVTTGLLIACLISFLAEALLTRTGLTTGPLPGWAVLLMLVIPYSINLYCSTLSLSLQISLSKLLEVEEAASGLLSTDQIERQAREMKSSDLCCVCMDKGKDAVLTPCGHRAVCMRCGESLRTRSRQCPVCRHYISAVVRVFDS